jgi:hypothetical protein
MSIVEVVARPKIQTEDTTIFLDVIEDLISGF